MCGICGVVQVDGAPRQVVLPDLLDRMTDAMAHRGPDDRGTFQADGVAFGVRRLSVVDVEGGRQPFASEDGRVVAMQNGELYNHEALRAGLRRDGHRLVSRCDTEILPHLYERDGPGFPARLRGMWGLAVWDGARRRAVVSRDRLGIKPVYYARAGDLLLFGSELKCLLASGLVSTELDYEAIDVYLALGFFAGPGTPLRAVRKLPPGCTLVVEDGDVRVEPYWHYPEPTPDHAMTLDDAAAGLLERLDDAVRMRLMSDVPLGAMLSGGLDSSLITALMARHHSEPVKTFSIGFREDGAANELADARFVAGVLGAEHHDVELSYVDDQVDLEDLVWHLDEPVADLSALGFLAVSQLAARHVTVALSGQGADELLGGYTKHRAARIAGAWRRLPRGLDGLPALVARHGPHRTRRAAATLAARTPAERLLAASGRVDERLRGELFRGPLGGPPSGAAARAVAALTADLTADHDGDPLATALYLDGRLALVDDMLQYFDRTSMAHSLEVRVPFLDHHVVEFCATIPSRLKVSARLETKHVLKHAARGLVPDRIVDKRKLGFLRSASTGWLRAQLGAASSDFLLGPDPRYGEFLDRAVVERMARAHRDGARSGDVHLLLAILMLEVWLSSYVPRAVSATGLSGAAPLS
ncbi:asparagine synthase (glutamine-hydrolyzing) [Dactylosporangium sp. CA-233914]|uniref:asparagine synthase (glutamine-hydrolyzing) n=1 Tax=Dactylosporangium sp. CA-233914 TaxID=3239934 RepID=UPI003D8C9ADC